MNLDHYSYFASNDFKDYEFYSIGPKGRIKKVVLFTRVVRESTFYNIAFGDIDPDTGSLNDTVVTDNNDRDLVLAPSLIRLMIFVIAMETILSMPKAALLHAHGSIK